jgi:hypothetical protein
MMRELIGVLFTLAMACAGGAGALFALEHAEFAIMTVIFTATLWGLGVLFLAEEPRHVLVMPAGSRQNSAAR